MSTNDPGTVTDADFRLTVEATLIRRYVAASYVRAARLFPWVVGGVVLIAGIAAWSIVGLSRAHWSFSLWYAYLPLIFIAYELLIGQPRYHREMTKRYERMWPIGSTIASKLHDDSFDIAISDQGWRTLAYSDCESAHVQFGILDAAFTGSAGRMALPIELTTEEARSKLRAAARRSRR